MMAGKIVIGEEATLLTHKGINIMGDGAPVEFISASLNYFFKGGCQKRILKYFAF